MPLIVSSPLFYYQANESAERLRHPRCSGRICSPAVRWITPFDAASGLPFDRLRTAVRMNPAAALRGVFPHPALET